MRRDPGGPVVCVLAIFAAACLGALSGCGGGEGVSPGAVVRVYVGASLCREAQRQLAAKGGRAGEVRVRVVCLREALRAGRLDLATVGANARRATQDSATIAYIEPPGRANRFSRPIVEEAGIAWEATRAGGPAVGRVLAAVAEAGSGSLREEVRKGLEASP